MTLHAVAAGVHKTGLLGKALSPDEVAPGWTALLLVVVLGVALWFLWRSMNGHLSKVPADFDEPGADVDRADPDDDERPAGFDKERKEQ